MYQQRDTTCQPLAVNVTPIPQSEPDTTLHRLLLSFTLTLFAQLFLFSSLAAAGEFDDLLSSLDSDIFTWQERKHFTEALDQFSKRWVGKGFSLNSGARWLDDEHIVFSTRRYPGWEGRYEEPSRVIALHVNTGEFTDLGYRGELQCLNHKGEMMIRLSPDPGKGMNHQKDDRWLIGTWGQPLQEIKWEPNSFIPKYLCRFSPHGDPIYSTNWKALPPDAHRIFPLLSEHGALKETVAIENRYIVHPVSLIKPDGSNVPLKMAMPINTYFEFQPWQQSYFNTMGTLDDSLTIYPSGEIKRHHAPDLLRFWHLTTRANGGGYGTRVGVLWTVMATSKIWRKHGFYLETSKGLLRIEEGMAMPDPTVSPNGCRIWSFVQRGDPYSRRLGPMGQMVIDICVATAPGKIVASGRTKTIQAVETASVTAIAVQEGDTVKAGDVLIELDATAPAADARRLAGEMAAAQLKTLRAKALLAAQQNGRAPELPRVADIPAAWMTEARRQAQGLFSEHQARLERVDADIERRRAELTSGEELARKLEQTLPLTRSRAQDYQDLNARNYVSRHAWLEKEQLRLEQESDLLTQRSRIK